jgi:hypothetical protein
VAALGGGATVAARDAAATVVVPGSTSRSAARHLGKRRRRPRPRFLLRRAALRGVPGPPRRALQPWQLRLLRRLPKRALRHRSRPLSTTVVRRDWSRPPGHQNGRCQAPPDRARRRSLSLPPGRNGVIGRLPSGPSHAEMLARPGTGRSGRRGVPAPTAISLPDLLQLGEFSFQFLFRCGKVMGCDSSWHCLPRCSAPVF